MNQVVIGTAGHIDHGKTTLVEALTGTNTDTLAQEKQRGITIDLGFAYLNENITIVDVPGHKKFIRNMVAGASTIHLGLLVIAADDGIMPQTIEHLHILNSLSVHKGITVITKIGLAEEDWIDLVISEVKEIEENTIFQDSPILKVDSISMEGVNDLKHTIISLVNTIKFEQKSEYFKMHVDRVFSKKGYGPVVTGTVKSGTLKVGDSVEILPEKVMAHVRGIQTHGGSVQKVKNGDRAALNLAKVDIKLLNRGTTVSNPGLISVTDKLLANLSMSPYTSWFLKNNQRIRVNIGTAEILARVRIFGKELMKNHNSNVIIIFERPVGVTINDQFVVRSYSPLDTIASGIVLETDFEYDRKFIEKCPVDILERLRYMISNFSHNPKTIEEWSKKYFISFNEMKEKLKLLDARVISDNGFVYFNHDFEYWEKETLSFIEKKCKHNSFHNYVEVNNIVQSLGISEKWAKHVIERLIKSNMLALKSGRISLVNQSLDLSEKIKIDLKKIISIIENSDSNIISIKEIIDISKLKPREIKEMIFLLNSQNKIIQINDSLIIDNNAFNNLLSSVREHFINCKTLSISDFKNISRLTRKNAIPILEYFDSRKFTKREGSKRAAGETLFVK